MRRRIAAPLLIRMAALPHAFPIRSDRWTASSKASAVMTLVLLPLAIILLALLETVVAQNVEFTQCPANPLDTCLFYFAGYDSTVPVIK